jgi:hypothetical protein
MMEQETVRTWAVFAQLRMESPGAMAKSNRLKDVTQHSQVGEL